MYFLKDKQVSEVFSLDDAMQRHFSGKGEFGTSQTLWVTDSDGYIYLITFSDGPGDLSTLGQLAPRSVQSDSPCIVRNVISLSMNGTNINNTGLFRVGYAISNRILAISSPDSPILLTAPIVKLMS